MYIERLKFLRERIGTTQQEIAEIINVKRGLYSQYETEYTIMPLKHINTICNFFNVSLDYIFNLTDKSKYSSFKKEIDKTISGKRLKEFRKENNLTQLKLANFLNTTQSTIAEYERGTNIIATPFLYTICSKYHISADYLLGKIDTPKYFK